MIDSQQAMKAMIKVLEKEIYPIKWGEMSVPDQVSYETIFKEGVEEVAAMAETEMKLLRSALTESVRLQSHYAKLLNGYDDGERMTFADVDEWMERLKEIGLSDGR